MKRFLSGDEADAERASVAEAASSEVVDSDKARCEAQRQRLIFLEARASSSFVLSEVQA